MCLGGASACGNSQCKQCMSFLSAVPLASAVLFVQGQAERGVSRIEVYLDSDDAESLLRWTRFGFNYSWVKCFPADVNVNVVKKKRLGVYHVSSITQFFSQ